MIQHITIVMFFTILYYASNFLSNIINNFAPELIKLLGFVLIGTLYTVVIYLWNHYIWKIFANKWHIHPNINGIYEVKIQSSYDNNDYSGKMIITQTYNNVCVKITFEKSEGTSYIAKIEKHNNDWHLLYSYQNTAKNFGLQKSGGVIEDFLI